MNYPSKNTLDMPGTMEGKTICSARNLAGGLIWHAAAADVKGKELHQDAMQGADFLNTVVYGRSSKGFSRAQAMIETNKGST